MVGVEQGAVAERLDEAARACSLKGAQLTELRRQVLALIFDAAGPVTAYQLLDRLRDCRKGAAPPTVYRALDFLLEQELIHRIERLNAFIACADTGHHHHLVQLLICRQCGSVAEVEDCAAAAALDEVAERSGFHPAAAVVEVEGVCAKPS